MKKITKEKEQEILEKVIKSELDIPHPKSDTKEPIEQYIRENVYGKWNAFKRWFLPIDGQKSECSNMEEADRGGRTFRCVDYSRRRERESLPTGRLIVLAGERWRCIFLSLRW